MNKSQSKWKEGLLPGIDCILFADVKVIIANTHEQIIEQLDIERKFELSNENRVRITILSLYHIIEGWFPKRATRKLLKKIAIAI